VAGVVVVSRVPSNDNYDIDFRVRRDSRHTTLKPESWNGTEIRVIQKTQILFAEDETYSESSPQLSVASADEELGLKSIFPMGNRVPIAGAGTVSGNE